MIAGFALGDFWATSRTLSALAESEAEMKAEVESALLEVDAVKNEVFGSEARDVLLEYQQNALAKVRSSLTSLGEELRAQELEKLAIAIPRQVVENRNGSYPHDVRIVEFHSFDGRVAPNEQLEKWLQEKGKSIELIDLRFPEHRALALYREREF